MTDVIDMDSVREARAFAEGLAAHERGEAFAVRRVTSEDLNPGITECGCVVVLMPDEENDPLSLIGLDWEEAIKLGVALIGMGEEIRARLRDQAGSEA